MPVEQTAHERAEVRVEYERKWNLEVVRLRQRLMRECPVGQALDREHVLTLIGQAWSSNVVILQARRFVAAGMQAHGYGRGAIARALGVLPAAVEEIAAPIAWWDPPASMLDDVPEEFRASVIGPR